MSREIEYRAWIPSWEEMVFSIDSEDINGVFWQLTNKGFVLSIDTCDEYGGGYKDFEGVTLMQYTGIKDKNGVKIFEGDVVVAQTVERSILSGDHISARLEGVIAYYDNSYCILKDGVYYASWTNAEEVEVTGNIHEEKLGD